jgi:hypothetical protein
LGDFNIEWLTPDGRPATDRGRDSVEDTVSHLGKVEAAVERKAESLKRDAEVHLLLHRRKGNAKVEIGRFEPTPGERTPDWYVYMKDEDPGGINHTGAGDTIYRSVRSIEFGWIQTHAFGRELDAPIPHKGLRILGGAMDRAVARYSGPQ